MREFEIFFYQDDMEKDQPLTYKSYKSGLVENKNGTTL